MEHQISHPGPSPHDLLLPADASAAFADQSVGRGRCSIAPGASPLTAVYGQRPSRPLATELLSLAIVHARQNIGKRLVAQAVRTAREAGFHRPEIDRGETASGQPALHERWGFVRCSISRAYFRKHAPASIVENGIECRDKELRILKSG